MTDDYDDDDPSKLGKKIFDEIESNRRKREGMKKAVEFRDRTALNIARAVAEEMGLEHPMHECHSDRVCRELEKRGEVSNLKKQAGSLFKGKTPGGHRWEFSGRRVPSSRISNHARELKVWRLLI